MNDPIKQAIYEELNTILKEPGQQNEERLKQLKFTEGKEQISAILITHIFEFFCFVLVQAMEFTSLSSRWMNLLTLGCDSWRRCC
jgi:hypothetical protein